MSVFFLFHTYKDRSFFLKTQIPLALGKGFGRTIEELLRYDGPVETSTTRRVRREIVMHGQRLQKGDVVRVVITSADHDHDQFPDPDQFDLMRQNQRYLQFGLGIHYCLGAPLARLEGEIAFLDLFRTYPKLRLAVPFSQTYQKLLMSSFWIGFLFHRGWFRSAHKIRTRTSLLLSPFT